MPLEGLEDRYVNFYTDFAFKKLFGTEVNKELLRSFLNSLLAGQEVITDLTYLNNEQLGRLAADRKAVFDVYCENERGERFIVEMQKAEQQFFKDRSVFYSTFPIREQAQPGKNWNYRLKSVYTIGILNFSFDDTDPEYYHHEVKLMDTKTKKVFYDKLTFIYLEMPKFTKTESQLETMFDKWLYAIKHLPDLLNRPKALYEKVFEQFFRAAEIAKFTWKEMEEYEGSLMDYWDWCSVFETAKDKSFTQGMAEGMEKGIEKGMAKGMAEGLEKGMAKGMAKGIEKGMAEGLEKGMAEGEKKGERNKALSIAREMLADGMRPEHVARYTNLPLEEVQHLVKDNK